MPETKTEGICSRCGYTKQVRVSLSCFTRWGREIKGHFCDFCWKELWMESTKHTEVQPEPIPDQVSLF